MQYQSHNSDVWSHPYSWISKDESVERSTETRNNESTKWLLTFELFAQDSHVPLFPRMPFRSLAMVWWSNTIIFCKRISVAYASYTTTWHDCLRNALFLDFFAEVGFALWIIFSWVPILSRKREISWEHSRYKEGVTWWIESNRRERPESVRVCSQTAFRRIRKVREQTQGVGRASF